MNELREVKEIFDKIASVSGKKEKEKIIKNNKNKEKRYPHGQKN